MMLWLLLTGCGDSGTLTTTEPPVATLSVVLEAPGVLDPKLEGDPSLGVAVTLYGDAIEDCTVSLVATDPAGRSALLAEASASWTQPLEALFTGLDEAGLPFDPGPVQLGATLDCGEVGTGFADAVAYIVRLGITAVDFDGGEDAGTVPLAFHKLDLVQRGITELDGIPEYLLDRQSPGELADLDRDDGTPRDPVPPWEDPDSPPWGDGVTHTSGLGQHNLPSAHVAGSTPQFTVTFGELAVSQATGLAVEAGGPTSGWSWLPRVVASADGLVEQQDWHPGAEVSFTLLDPVPTTLEHETLTLSWTFDAEAEDGSLAPIPGTLTTTHTRYTTAGQSEVPDGRDYDAAPPVTWIGVLADLQEAVSGLEASDTFGIMDALREDLHHDEYLVYNPNDAAYSEYSGSYITWDWIWVDLSEWLDRSDGIELYCHSVACMLSTLANHLGLPAEYVTVAYSFKTHLTRAAGESAWQQWDFSSHGIVTLDGTHVWDAAVDIDGDESPDDLPVEAVSPMGLTLDEYLLLLTDDPIDQVNGGRCFVR